MCDTTHLYRCVTWLTHMWHDSFTCATWLVFTRLEVWWYVDIPFGCDVSHSHVQHDSLIYYFCVYDVTRSYVQHDSPIQHRWHTFVTVTWFCVCVTWLIHMCDMTHSINTGSTYLRQSNGLVCVKRLFDMWNTTHLYVRYDSFTYATWLIHMCNMTHSYFTGDIRLCPHFFSRLHSNLLICKISESRWHADTPVCNVTHSYAQ